MLEWEKEKKKPKKKEEKKTLWIKMAKCQDWLSMFFWASNLLLLLCIDHLKKNNDEWKEREREREKKRKEKKKEKKIKKKRKEKKRKKKKRERKNKEEEWREKEEENPECHPSLEKLIPVQPLKIFHFHQPSEIKIPL